MLEITECADEADERLSLEVYNPVWPQEAISMEEVRHYKASVPVHLDLVARIDGEPAGSGFAAIEPQRPDLVAERPELVRGIYEVALEALPDIPGCEDEQIEPFEDWLAHDMQGSGDRPEATFVALAGGEVVGYSKFSLTSARPTTAHHDLTGVKRAWRGRGVGRALKATQIRWAKENGYEELRTGNDERNAPIRHLNRQLGYLPAVGRIYLRGPLARPNTVVTPISGS